MKKFTVKLVRILAAALFIWSVFTLIVLAGEGNQKDTLPKTFFGYVKLMDDDSMAPAAGRGSLVVLRETNPFRPGDIASYLDDQNRVMIRRILSIGGSTEDVSVEVPYEELRAAAANLAAGADPASKVMPDDPDIVMVSDADGTTETIPADRLNGKAVMVSAALGAMLMAYRNPAAAAFLLIVSFLLMTWPFGRHVSGRPKFSERDIHGPSI